MKAFLKIFLMEVLFFVKSIWIWLATIVLIAYLILGYHAFVISGNDTVSQILQASAYIVTALTLTGLLIGIISSNRERKVNFDEVFFSLPGTAVGFLSKLSAWSVITFLTLIIPYIEILIFYNIQGTPIYQFEYLSFLYIYTYWGLPFLSCIIIGYSLSRLINSGLVYSAGFLICFLLSPYNTSILNGKLSVLLNQAEENITDSYNYFSGFNLFSEIFERHIFLLVLSVCLLFITVLWKESISRIKKLKITLLCLIAANGVFLLILTPYISNTLSFDSKKVYSDSVKYYKQNVEKSDYKSANCKVSKYQIDLKHNGQSILYHLNISIDTQNTKEDWIYFTLFNQFRASNIKLNGKDVEWKRDGDFLYIKPNNKGFFLLSMDVQGTSNIRSFVTYNSLSLLSSFPWYPIPGNYKLFINPDSSSNLLEYRHFNSIHLPYEVDFDIKVDNGKRIFSNIEKTSHNEFKGRAAGATLLCGNLVQERYNGLNIVSPSEFIVTIKKALPHLDRELREVESKLGKSGTKIPKNVFVVPFYQGILNTYALEYDCDQLMVDSQVLKNFSSREELLFEPSNIMSAFFLTGQYKENETFALSLLPQIVQDLCSNKKQNVLFTENIIQSIDFFTKVKKDSKNELMKAKRVSSYVVDLLKKDETKKLEMFLLKSYKEMDKRDATLDFFESLVNSIEKGD